MSLPVRRSRLAGALLASIALFGPHAASRADYSISNNLAGTSGGVESAAGSTYIAAGFGSGAGGVLSSVTLALANSVAGVAELDIYTDDGLLEPGTRIGVLTHSGAYSSAPSSTTWSASGITLAANTSYWVVLKATTGQFDWSWNLSNTGTGAGYQGTWGSSDDAGADWFTYNAYATQMNVSLVGTAAAAVPEPSTIVLLGLGLVGLGLDRARRARVG